MDHSAVVDWVRRAAIPLSGAEPLRGLDDLAPLRAVIGAARVVSLGEATHGTREFFTLKHRLIELCVAELGFTMVVMEANFAESLAVNDYVLHGAGTAAAALAGLRWWTWDTTEVRELLEWMRAWNACHARKVKFYGYDIADPPMAALGLIAYLERVAPPLAAEARAELAPLTSDLTVEALVTAPAARRATVRDCIDRLRRAFARHRAGWIDATSAIDWHLGALHAQVLDQSVSFVAERATYPHERAVAENICALLAAEGPDAKAVLWAHNAHVARAPDPHGDDALGVHLDRMIGRAQVVVGFSFDRGSFRARAWPSDGVTDHVVASAPAATFDAVLAQAGLPLFCLDIARAPAAGPVADWLATEMPMRSIGGLYGLPADNQYGITCTERIVPRRYFDVVVFVAATTAARANRPRPTRAARAALARPPNLALARDEVPDDWQLVGTVEGEGSGADAAADGTSAGCRAVRVWRTTGPRWRELSLVQVVEAQPWRGQRVRFAANLRMALAEPGAGALLFIKIVGARTGQEAEFYATPRVSLSNEAPLGCAQWTRTSAEIDVPRDAERLTLGLLLSGCGSACFADLHFDCPPCDPRN